MDFQVAEGFVSFGDGVKTLARDGDYVTIGARGVLFGTAEQPDLARDYFLHDCYFGARKGVGVDMMLNHGIPLGNSDQLKAYADILLPPLVKTEVDEDGLLYQAVYDLRDGYQRRIYKMIEDGLLSSSSGAISHTVKRENGAKSGGIKRWIIGEMSLTPTPCEFRLGMASPIKSLMESESFEPDAMNAAIKTLSDTSFSLNVPLELPKPEPEIKAQYLGKYLETDMAMGALSRLNDALMYGVVSSALSPSVYPMDGMFVQDAAPIPVGKRMRIVKAAFDEFSTIAVDIIGRAMNAGEGDAAAKTLMGSRGTSPSIAPTPEEETPTAPLSEEVKSFDAELEHALLLNEQMGFDVELMGLSATPHTA